MKDFPSCFGENAVQVSDFSSSSSSSSGSNKTGHNLVTNVYQCGLGLGSCLITIGWSKNLIGQGFSVGIDDSNTDQCLCKIDINPWLFSKRKGSKSLESAYSSKIDIYWDLSSAKFIGSSPEPFEGFYLAIISNQQMILLIGDMSKEAFKKTSPVVTTTTTNSYPSIPFAKREHIYGKKIFNTKVRFFCSGHLHDLVVECDTSSSSSSSSSGFVADPCLVIRVDSKIVMQVKRLQWKFRGNHTILVDGLTVEVLWDVHNWLSGNSSNGNAVFMFKSIVSPEKQWTSRELVMSDQDSSWSQRILDTRAQQNQGFSLILYAWKSE